MPGNLLGQWKHTFANGSSLEGRTSWEHTGHGLASLPFAYTAIDSELQYDFSLGSRNDLVWGMDYKGENYISTASPGHSLLPASPDVDTYVRQIFDDRE